MSRPQIADPLTPAERLLPAWPSPPRRAASEPGARSPGSTWSGIQVTSGVLSAAEVPVGWTDDRGNEPRHAHGLGDALINSRVGPRRRPGVC